MATPNQMPRKNNAAHQAILAGLLATKPVSWVKKTWNEEKKYVDTVKVAHEEPRHPLARNFSAENIERLAKRWLR